MFADNERRLARKCAELSTQAVEASARAQTAQVLGTKDSKTISSLKEEEDRAWAALEASHQKVGLPFPSSVLWTYRACNVAVYKEAQPTTEKRPSLQEASAAQTITMLKDEMDELTALVEAGPAAEEEQMLAALLKEKDTLLRERDTQVGGRTLVTACKFADADKVSLDSQGVALHRRHAAISSACLCSTGHTEGCNAFFEPGAFCLEHS